MDYNILVSDKVHEKGIDLFLSRPGFHVDVKTGLTADTLKDIIGDYHGLVIRSDTRVTGQILAAAYKLKVIGKREPASTCRCSQCVPERDSRNEHARRQF